jgi:NAD(P)H-nitrite reductase large subunit
MDENEIIVCRCEELTVKDVLRAISLGAKDLDAVKRITRAGMGLCQGRTCSILIRNILHRELKIDKKDLSQVTPRPPVRLVPSKVFLDAEEQALHGHGHGF